MRVVTEANAKSKSEKFPPPHEDAAVGVPLGASHNGPVSFGAADSSFGSAIFDPKSSPSVTDTGSRRKSKNEHSNHRPLSRRFIPTFIPSAISLSMDLRFKGKGSVSEVFGSRRERK